MLCTGDVWSSTEKLVTDWEATFSSMKTNKICSEIDFFEIFLCSFLFYSWERITFFNHKPVNYLIFFWINGLTSQLSVPS